jgi:hypothetical protein
MRIIKATYGGKDCTKEIQSKIKDNKLIIRSSNSIIGDPSIGTLKYLVVDIEGEKTIKVKEGDLLVFPKTKLERVGIFYSNNNTPKIYPAIQASLKSIEKSAEGKADIYTCMWKHEPLNPFIEYIAWTQTSSHLNQLLQIMQLLYSARQVNDYKYVSFLEHDVLYSEGYFDYPEFENGEVYTNMNYIGMNKDGFQSLGQRDEPFHQMTMRFDDAIKHCESILPNALITNNGLIETQKLKRKQWNCVNPSVHINHGYHFTSHYNVYNKTGISKTNPYWGNIDNWKYLIE